MLKSINLLVFISWLVFSLSSCSQAPSQQSQLTPVSYGLNFDWDDNIAFMPTSIVLFHKKNHSELMMDTGSFALFRKKIGVSGNFKNKALANYEIRVNQDYNSFRYFRDGRDGTNYFLNDLKKAMQADPKKWQGPVWNDFIKALNDEKMAKNSTIITARGHSPQAMVEGLDYLKNLGIIRFLIPAKNIYPVSNKLVAQKFVAQGSAARPSAIKAKVMLSLLDQLQKNALLADLKEVLGPNGEQVGRYLLWEFSDDDYGNYSKAVEVLSQEVRAGRWPNIKITLIYTGLHDKTHKPTEVVIREDGSIRKKQKSEKEIIAFAN